MKGQAGMFLVTDYLRSERYDLNSDARTLESDSK